MIIETCTFDTDRLVVGPWHAASGDGWSQLVLAEVVAEMMTEPVTRHLPEAWQGVYTPRRAQGWIVDRDNESSTLLVVERRSSKPAGLVILFESPEPADGLIEIRLGFLLAEASWGKGLATELLGGLIRWCREHPRIGSITAGVARANESSRRVLERLGFSQIDGAESHEEQIYQLQTQIDSLHCHPTTLKDPGEPGSSCCRVLDW